MYYSLPHYAFGEVPLTDLIYPFVHLRGSCPHPIDDPADLLPDVQSVETAIQWHSSDLVGSSGPASVCDQLHVEISATGCM